MPHCDLKLTDMNSLHLHVILMFLACICGHHTKCSQVCAIPSSNPHAANRVQYFFLEIFHMQHMFRLFLQV